MKVGELQVGALYKIRQNVRLVPFRRVLLGCALIKWGSIVNEEEVIPSTSIFQYLGKKRIANHTRKENKKIYYTQHTFLLLLDSREYILSGYSIRNIEPLYKPKK